MKTTLNQIRAKSPCQNGWTKLLAYLGKTKADDEPISIATILDSNGLNDALWCLQAVKGRDREIRLFGVWCARQVQHLMTDPRSIAALDVSERFANCNATQEELVAEWAAASDAAWAAWAASDASDAARAAARAAARVAAWAASDAAWAAWAASDAADAARAAARAAAWAASDAAADAASDAADAASDAADAASDAAWADQEKRLRELCAEVALSEVSK